MIIIVVVMVLRSNPKRDERAIAHPGHVGFRQEEILL